GRAGAVGAVHDGGLAVGHGEGHVVGGGEPGEADREALGPEDRRADGPPPIAVRGTVLRQSVRRHALENVQAGGTTVFSLGITSMRRCLLSLISKMNSRRKAWWSSLRRVLSPCGKSSLSLTSMLSSA